jgi:acyl-CoA dehydrogenase
VAAKANPANPRDIGLFLVEERMDGFRRGRLLKKLGFHTQDTAEIFFENVCLEPIHVIGDPAKGLNYMSAAWPRSG